VEAELVAGTAELPAGVIDPDLLQAEVDAYAAVGMFGEETPDLEGTYVDVLTEVYADDGTVIWPSG
jgi:ribosomal protein L11